MSRQLWLDQMRKSWDEPCLARVVGLVPALECDAFAAEDGTLQHNSQVFLLTP
jgi:hypothetical protein